MWAFLEECWEYYPILSVPKRKNFQFAEKLYLKLMYPERIIAVNVKGLQRKRIWIYSGFLVDKWTSAGLVQRRLCKPSSIAVSWGPGLCYGTAALKHKHPLLSSVSRLGKNEKLLRTSRVPVFKMVWMVPQPRDDVMETRHSNDSQTSICLVAITYRWYVYS